MPLKPFAAVSRRQEAKTTTTFPSLLAAKQNLSGVAPVSQRRANARQGEVRFMQQVAEATC
jgi:hypothetical protein